MTGAMKEQDRKIVLELKRRLSADLQKRVIKFILYGSRARGVNAERTLTACMIVPRPVNALKSPQ